MNKFCTCYGGAKDGSLSGEEHNEALGKGEVCSKCMLQRWKVEAAIFI